MSEGRTSSKDGRSAVDRLLDGVASFRRDVFPRRKEQFGLLARGQDPDVLFITCADSRVMPEMITRTEPGELFISRNIGNVVPGYGAMMGGVSAVIEFAVQALKVRSIVVCGHSDCGAMKGLLVCDDPEMSRTMPAVTNWLRNALAARSIVDATRPGLTGADKVQALVEQNVFVQLQNLRTHPAVAARLAEGSLTLHGWVYDIETGGVRVGDEATGTFAEPAIGGTGAARAPAVAEASAAE